MRSRTYPKPAGQARTIKRYFHSNTPEVLALAKSLGLAIKGIEYVTRNHSYESTKRNFQ